MAWKVQITGISASARQQLPLIAQTLAKLPGISQEQITEGLQHLPFDLPSVPGEDEAQKLILILRRLGLNTAARRIEEKKTSPPPSQMSTAPSFNDRRHPEIFDDPEDHPHSIELENEPLSRSTGTKQHPRSSRSVWKQLLLLLAILVGIALTIQWMQNRKKSPENLKQTNSEATEFPQQTVPPPPQNQITEASSPQSLRERRELAQRQTRYSNQLLSQAQKTPDARESARLTEQALKYNPYNESAWATLFQKMQRLQDQEGMQRAQKGMQRSQKVRQVLKSIAQRFGTQAQVDIDPTQVSFQRTNPTPNPQDFHHNSQQIYDQVHIDHSEKDFAISQQTDSMDIRIPTGEKYPTYQEWQAQRQP